MLQALKNAVTNHLKSFGWSQTDGPSVGTKMYPTVVGPKEAFAYIQDFGPECENVLLAGTYYSEGRNILEPMPVLISRTADGEDIRRKVTEFIARADVAVAESYAAKLLADTDRFEVVSLRGPVSPEMTHLPEKGNDTLDWSHLDIRHNLARATASALCYFSSGEKQVAVVDRYTRAIVGLYLDFVVQSPDIQNQLKIAQSGN